MPKRLKEPKLRSEERRLVSTFISPELFQRLEDERKKIGLSRAAFCAIAILNEIERYEDKKNEKRDFSC